MKTKPKGSRHKVVITQTVTSQIVGIVKFHMEELLATHSDEII